MLRPAGSDGSAFLLQERLLCFCLFLVSVSQSSSSSTPALFLFVSGKCVTVVFYKKACFVFVCFW